MYGKRALVLLAACGVVQMACGDGAKERQPAMTATSKSERTMNEQLAVSPDDPRDQIPISGQSREALTPLVRAMVRVIAKQSPLEGEGAILGVGTDHVPKSDGPVVLRYYRTEVGLDSVEVRFERQDGNTIWSVASFTIRPLNFPRGVYAMGLPSTFFDGLGFEARFGDERPKESVKRVNVFRYRANDRGVKVQLDFEARADVASLEDQYPRSFHRLTVRRVE
jgi:hypothetical protein